MDTLSKRLLLALLALTLIACNSDQEEPAEQTAAQSAAAATTALSLTSPAFTEGSPIPQQYTCDGDNISPALEWQGIPAETASLALIMDDPDAPGRTWVHWVLYNIPPNTTALPKAVVAADVATPGQGSNSRTGYAGPCPPSGTHRYFFKLYALDTTLDLAEGSDKEQLLTAMESHILAEAQLMGTYER